MTTFAVWMVNGAAWVPGVDVRTQPFWDEHAAFIDQLFDEGHILLSGPYADGTGALLIVEADTEHPEQVHAMFNTDPWTTHHIRHVAEVKRWQIFLNARARQP
jgi:uncharacterized protein YciI